MVNLPPKVKSALEQLRKSKGKYIEIKGISGHYYAFEVEGHWDSATKKKIKRYLYLGRITDDGVFKEGKHRIPDPAESPAGSDIKPGRYDKEILTNLSMNARMPISVLAKRLGLSATATRYHVQRLGKKLGIRYTVELVLGSMGYMQFIIFVKFLGNRPPLSELKAALSNEPRIQLAALVKGEFDLIIYLLAEDSYKANEIVWKLRTETDLKGFDSLWNLNTFYREYGSVPLRQDFFDKVLKNRITKKRSDKSLVRKYGFYDREVAVLRELNANGREEFANIDRSYGLDRGSAQYTYLRLKQSGIINRTTISLDCFKRNHVGVIWISYINMSEFRKTQNKLLFNIITNRGPINNYSLMGDLGAPNGAILFMPATYLGELEDRSEELRKTIKGVRIETLFVTDILVGSFCYRAIDNSYSIQYGKLVSNRVITSKEKTRYE